MISRIALIALLGVATAEVSAQEAPKDTFRLSEIVVTATRVPVAAVTAATTVISSADLQGLGITHLHDALSAVAGVSLVQTGSFGGTASLYLRGGESGYTRVLLDGVALNQPGGAIDFGALTVADVDRIEIVRGPASVLYGSDAVTGVIQIFTRRGAGPARLAIEASAGTYRTGAMTASLTGGGPGASYGVHLSRYQTDGIHDFNSEYQNSVLSGSVRLAPDEATDVSFAMQYRDHVYHYPTDGAGRVVDHNAFQFSRRFSLGVDAGRRLSAAVEGRVSLATTNDDGGTDDRADGPGDTLGFFSFRSLQTTDRRNADVRANIRALGGSVITVGAQAEEQRERSLNQSASEFGPDGGLFDGRRWNAAGYAQVVGVGGRFAWNASSRLDRNQAFGTFTTLRAGLSYRPTPDLKIRATVGTAFREPTFFENFATGFVRGNPALVPERATSWDVGTEFGLRNGAGRVSATWFDQRFQNLIEFTFAPPRPTDPNYFNIAAARAQGLEIEAVARVLRPLSLHGAYTHLRTRVAEPGLDTTAFGLFVTGRPLVRRPTHAASAGASWTAGRGSLQLRVRHVGNREDIDFNAGERIVLGSFTTLDAAAEYGIRRGAQRAITLRVRVANVFNLEYEQVKGFASPGRAILIGMRGEL